MNSGTIKFFNESKGYGFIKDDNSEQEYFVHATGLKDNVQKDDKVTFNLVDGKNGKNAVDVAKA